MALSVAAMVLACRGAVRDRSAGTDGAYGGTLVISTPVDVNNLLPPLARSTMDLEVIDILYERLAQIGPELNTIGDQGFRGQLADRWTWSRDSLSIAFHLDPRARWHDGRPVTSRDVRFTFDVYRDPLVDANERPLIAQIDSVTTPDSLTAVYWFHARYPEQFFDAAYQMRILPQHVLGGVKPADLKTSPLTRTPVGTGRYRFVRWEPGSVIELVADTAYRLGRPHLDRLIWTVSGGYDPAALKVLSGDADFLEFLRPATFRDVLTRPTLRATAYPSLDEGYLQFNVRDPHAKARPHPILGDRALRRALAMAVDRQRVVRNIFDTLALVATCPATRAQFTWDSTIAQIAFDPQRAKRVLDSLGWREASGGAGRERNGRPLRFSILVPTSSAVRIQMAEVLQEMLRQVGVRVDVDKTELNQMGQRVATGAFDAVLMATHHDPSPGGIRQLWSTGAIGGEEGTNYSGYSNRTFDALVDSGLKALDAAKARGYYRRAYDIIVQDAPAIWLYETKNYAAHHRRVHPVGMRADAWWAQIADWTIPANERIARDRIGVVARTP